MYRTFYTILFIHLYVALVAQDYPHVLPESTYPYWPAYQYLGIEDLDTIQAQPWIAHDHVISGWDWSFPDFVEPSPRSIVGLQRNLSVSKEFKPLDLQFKSNSTGILWVKWRDIEKTPGDFDFSPVINRINQAGSVGSDIILRILCHSKSRDGDISKGEAPLWLEDLGVNLLPQEDPKHNLNFDPSHPEFHKHYLRLVGELAKTEIPELVKAAYVGYASHSFGDEGIGPYRETSSEANDTVQHVRERLDAWENAFRGMEYKMFMGAPLDYGFRKGFGFRRGFVEMYLYRIPAENEGQYIDDNGYLSIDEEAPVFKYRCFNGDVNEEYEAAWATESRDFRFGFTTNSFPYRYFTSNLRALQMHCTYIHTTGHLVPKMLPFISQELARTVEDTPDAWSFLRTSYLRASNYRNNDYRDRVITAEEEAEGIETKNFERWLYQRDAPGYETTPAVKIQQAIKMWMVQEDKYYDYIARKGKKIGFNVDDRLFPGGAQPMAVKVSFYDGVEGSLKLVYRDNEGIRADSVAAEGKDTIRTATFFITARMDDTGFDHDFDFILESEAEVPVVFVRVVKTSPTYINTDQSPYGGMNRTIPGLIEGEHYDVGDEGFAYHDDMVKEGDSGFRPADMVDVVARAGASNDSTVSYTAEGEWLEYLVDVTAGKYNITLFYYCGEEPGELAIGLNGAVLDTIRGLENKGWNVRDSITLEEIHITGGMGKILRLGFVNGAGFDIDAIQFEKIITPVSGVELSGCPQEELLEGEKRRLSAAISPADADETSVSWHSSDTLVATVDHNGLVTAIGDGAATISVTTTDGEYTDHCALNVTRIIIPVYGVTIGDCPRTILETGDTHLLLANVAPPEATDTGVRWSSSNPEVASVDENGLVSAISQGTATITVTTTDGGYTGTCSLGVMSTGIAVTGVMLTGCPDESLAVDTVCQLGTEVVPSNAGDLRVNWQSSDTSVAKVDHHGLLIAVSAGAAIITVTTNEGGFTGECAVIVGGGNIHNAARKFSGEIKVYPNPANQEIFFAFPGSGVHKHIRIYNLYGQLLKVANTDEEKYMLDIGDLPTRGMLVVEIYGEQGHSMVRIIKN